MSTEPVTEAVMLRPSKRIPNNPLLPVIIHRRAFGSGETVAPPEEIERTFAANSWADAWRDSVYPYDHFHSNAHEVLGIYRGSAQLQLGGDDGKLVEVAAGDVIVLPAGTGHRNVGASADFAVVGAYPQGQSPDLEKSGSEEAAERVSRVPLPAADPVFGRHGPLLRHWRAAPVSEKRSTSMGAEADSIASSGNEDGCKKPQSD